MADGATSMSHGELLYVVIPVYNEELSVANVIREWATALQALAIDFRLLVLDDGSSDGTAEVLAALAPAEQRLEIVRKSNSGHGQTCIAGYREAILRGAHWVLQIDSDGQCDPQYFATVWARRKHAPAVFGVRVNREDGLGRSVISWLCQHLTRALSGVSVRDPNVPYRLLRSDLLATAIDGFPADFKLANILLSVIVQQGLRDRRELVEIGFRRRTGGQASVTWTKFAREAALLSRSLWRAKGHAAARARAVARFSDQ
jgi:dolichol-phosphate mannosyltransferase